MRSREEQIKALAVSLMDEGCGKEASYAFAQDVIDAAIQIGRELERAEMGRDTERLNFLDRAQIDAMRANCQWEILSMSGDTAETIGTGDTMREAIDAAMNGENGNA